MREEVQTDSLGQGAGKVLSPNRNGEIEGIEKVHNGESHSRKVVMGQNAVFWDL
jgi:hypothetical protein